MSTRHDVIGIKQAIRYEWMQKAGTLLLSGMSHKNIRQELHDYLENRMGSGTENMRSTEARSFAVGILVNTWITPHTELIHLRDSLLEYIEKDGEQAKAAHWAMLSSAYPFWHNVAQHTGRLFALQEKVTMKQIIARLIERYGDRQTVSRNVQFAVRSFFYWGLLKDSEIRGCYEKNEPLSFLDPNLTVLMFESALHALPDNTKSLGVLLNNPAFFPFKIPAITGDFVAQQADRIDVAHYGGVDELLKIKNPYESIKNHAQHVD